MPSTSKAQQKFMGLVHAYKKGEVPASKVSKAVKDAAKSMKKSSTKKYASTKHTDLPDKVKEERDYKEEYKKYGSSTKAKKYRAELNQYNRKKGTYGNGDGKDASHKGGKIVGFESQSKNRGRAEKSRLKKETVNEDGHTDVASIERKLKLIIQDSVDTIKKLRSMSNEDSLPSWWTDKITLAKDYVSKSRDYIMNPAESVNEEWTLYTTTRHGKKLQKLKSYKSKKAAAIALGKLSAKLDTPRFPKNVDGLMIIDESIQLPHGMELGKVFTGHGKSFVKEAVEPVGNIKKVLDVAKNQQSKKIGSTLVDLTTANLMTQVWNKVNDSSKEKMNKMNAKQLTNLILKLWDRVGTPRV